MNAEIKTIHLLLLEPSSNQAEAIINALRNMGFAVRATQVLTPEELSSALERGISDLLLANLNHPDLSAPQAIEQIACFGRDIPAIILMDEHDDDILTEAMNYGAKDGVTKDNLPLLCLKVLRELQSLENRRKKIQTELTLKATEKRCTLLLNNSQDAIAYVHDGMHIYANNAYLELFGYRDIDELLCMPALDMIAKKSQDDFRQYLKSSAAATDQQSFSFTGSKSDMSEFDAIMTLSPASYDDEACTQLIIRSATDNTELEEKLRELSAQDTLTDLYNKSYFLEQLQKAIEFATEKSRTFNVLFIEYDQYNKILSEYGIAGVDQLTIDCAKWLAHNIPEEFNLARMTDHAFALLLPDSLAEKARGLAEKLCNDISEHLFDVENHTFKITFSIGICPVGDNSEDANQIISDAHNASKRVENGNGYKVYNKAIKNVGTKQDVQMLEVVQEAIESGRIKLLFQPIVKLHGEEKSLYQVLLEICDKSGKALDTTKIFPIAKTAGLAEKLDRWIIKQTLKAITKRESTSKTQLFVSLSSSSLIDSNFIPFINKTVKTSKLPKNAIVFQVEQNDAINHLKKVIAFCGELKSNGYSICLSGYGSDPKQKLLIDQLDPEFVKIADTLSKNMHKDEAIAEKITLLLEEIHSQDKLSIISKVEEAAMLAALWPMNVRYIQGYYLQRPGPEMNYDFYSSGF